MSYNIKAGQESDIDQIADVIDAHNPDVVALQEVDVNWGERSEYMNQVRYLGKELNMHYYFGEIYALPPSEEKNKLRQYGLAFLSKHPLGSQENHRLTRLSFQDDEAEPQRMMGFPEVSIKVAGHRIHLFNTHLDYRSDPAIRKIQANEMLGIINNLEAPVLLMGDFNAEPDDSEIRKIFEEFNDVWKYEDKDGFTFPADSPKKRIDYILHSSHFIVSEAFVVESQKSDHRPVVSDLILKKN